ncbi:ferredoxin [Gordonia rubripertincta]|uniref:ferredoxin n=1 Tax=Gordonia rubripertincta TaxID=36822 RepID=UPI000B8DA464|nr:ferredoxin [Gordonia rubripertincta]ASR01242.1 Ferredoxin [Gordonia rubripertincta]
MKVVLDRARCTGLGICESLASDFFEIDDDGSLLVLKDEVAEADLMEVEEAISGCPTEALRLLRDSE